MPKCNGHESELGWRCSVCGASISYKEACRELLQVPKVEPKFQPVAALFVGIKPSVRSAAVLSILEGETESMSKDAFVATRANGSASWLDLRSRYRERVEGWLGAVGFRAATYRMVVVDTTDPLSVLAISSVQTRGTVVLAVIADSESTPLQQNTSYVALKLATKVGLPVVVCSKAYADEAAFFVEGEGFKVGAMALEKIVNLFESVIDDATKFMAEEMKLGVSLHCFSATLTASDAVYKSPDDALSVQMHATSLDVYPDEVQTVFLAAFASDVFAQEIVRSFTRYRVKTMKGVITAGQKVYARVGDPRFYDLLLVYGLRESQVFPLLADGYQKVAEMAPELKEEALK